MSDDRDLSVLVLSRKYIDTRCTSHDSRTRALMMMMSFICSCRNNKYLLHLLFARLLRIFGFIEICIRALFSLCLRFVCASQDAGLRRSLGGGHFYALGTAVASVAQWNFGVVGALRHSAGGTMEFAKLSNEASREASPPPCLVNLLHLVVTLVASNVVNQLHGFPVWERVEPRLLEQLQ
jgi:hypothetical protein